METTHTPPLPYRAEPHSISGDAKGTARWWMSGSPRQDMEATTEYIKSEEPHLVVLVDGDVPNGCQPWEVLPAEACAAFAPTSYWDSPVGGTETVLMRTLRQLWRANTSSRSWKTDIGVPSSPGWRLVVETEDRRGVRTCFVHLYHYHQHPFGEETL